jgi:hypothetical protein
MAIYRHFHNQLVCLGPTFFNHDLVREAEMQHRLPSKLSNAFFQNVLQRRMEDALAKSTEVRTVTHFCLQVLNPAVLS